MERTEGKVKTVRENAGIGEPTVSEHSTHLTHQAKTLVNTRKEPVFVNANSGPSTMHTFKTPLLKYVHFDLDPNDCCISRMSWNPASSEGACNETCAVPQ